MYIHSQKLLFLFLISFFVFKGSQAQSQSPLSLSDAISQGLDNNYDMRIEQSNIEIDRNNNNWGEAGRYPSISLNFTYQPYNRRNVDNEASFLQGTTLSNTILPSIQLDWVLFDGFRANITKSRLEKLQLETEGNAEIVIQNTIQAIILGYYRAVYEQERIEVLETTLAVSRDRYNYVLLKKELGSAVTTDVLLEEGNYLTDSLNLLNQQLTYRNAIRDLNELMATDIENTYSLADPLDFSDRAYDFEDLLNKMSSNNANLKRQYITQSIAEENIALAKADLYPRVTFQSSYSYNISGQDLTNADFAFDNPNRPLEITARTTTFNTNFSLTYNLFNGGRVKRAIKNAMVNYDINQKQVDQLKLSLSRDLAAQYDLYNNRRLLKGIAARRKEAAEQNLELSLERFRTGTINSFDYREVQINYLNAALTDLEATYNLIDSNTSLLRLTGGIVDVPEGD